MEEESFLAFLDNLASDGPKHSNTGSGSDRHRRRHSYTQRGSRFVPQEAPRFSQLGISPDGSRRSSQIPRAPSEPPPNDNQRSSVRKRRSTKMIVDINDNSDDKNSNNNKDNNTNDKDKNTNDKDNNINDKDKNTNDKDNNINDQDNSTNDKDNSTNDKDNSINDNGNNINDNGNNTNDNTKKAERKSRKKQSDNEHDSPENKVRKLSIDSESSATNAAARRAKVKNIQERERKETMRPTSSVARRRASAGGSITNHPFFNPDGSNATDASTTELLSARSGKEAMLHRNSVDNSEAARRRDHKLTRTLANLANTAANDNLGSIDERIERLTKKGECAVLASKATVTVVEGGACDFVSIRLSHQPTHPVMVEILDLGGQVTAQPKAILFDAKVSPDAQRGDNRITTVADSPAGNDSESTTQAQVKAMTTDGNTDDGPTEVQLKALPSVSGMGRPWDVAQLIRILALDDDAAEEQNETSVLTFKVHSSDLRFSTHMIRGRGQVDPANVRVSVIDNDGKYMYQFGDLLGPFGLSSSVCDRVRQFPVQVPVEQRRFDTTENDEGENDGNNEGENDGNNDASAAKRSREVVVPHYARPRQRFRKMSTSATYANAKTAFAHEKSAHSAPPSVPQASNFRAVAAGGHHVTVLHANGMLFSQGAGEYGQLGNGTVTRSNQNLAPWRGVDSNGELHSVIRHVANGKLHSAMITDDGKVLMVGSNKYGQLGMPTRLAVGSSQLGRERDTGRPSSVVPGATNARRSSHGLGRAKRGSSGARNDFDSQSPNQSPANSPSNGRGSHSYHHNNHNSERIFHDEDDYGMNGAGNNSKGASSGSKCGPDGSPMMVAPYFVRALSRVRVTQVACGDNHTLAIAVTKGRNGDSNQVFGWGQGVYGAIGAPCVAVQPTPRLVEELHDKQVFRVACGSLHSAVLCGTGHLYTSGNGGRGRLGRRVCAKGHSKGFARVTHYMEDRSMGNKTDSPSKSPQNIHGKLQQQQQQQQQKQQQQPQPQPQQQKQKQKRQRQLQEDDTAMGKSGHLDDILRELAAHRCTRRSCDELAFTDVACGGAHTGVLTESMELFVCGANEYGQLGIGDTDDRHLLTNVTFLSKHKPCAVSFGYFHSSAVSVNGNLFVWGCNDQGQLGLGPNVLTQNLPRLHDKLMGLDVVQVHAGRGFTTVLTHLSVEHLILLNYTDEDRFLDKKLEMMSLKRNEVQRFHATKNKLHEAYRKRELLKRQQAPSFSVLGVDQRRVGKARSPVCRPMQVVEVSKGTVATPDNHGSTGRRGKSRKKSCRRPATASKAPVDAGSAVQTGSLSPSRCLSPLHAAPGPEVPPPIWDVHGTKSNGVRGCTDVGKLNMLLSQMKRLTAADGAAQAEEAGDITASRRRAQNARRVGRRGRRNDQTKKNLAKTYTSLVTGQAMV